LVEDTNDQECLPLSELYVFCEKVKDAQSKAAVLAAFVETSQKVHMNNSSYFANTNSITTVYDGTLDGDPLRQFFVDCYALRAYEAWFKKDKADYHNRQFLFDVMTEMAKRRAQVSDYSKIRNAEHYCKKLLEAEE